MRNRPLLTAIVAGFLSATGFAPLDWWLVSLVCFAILLGLTHDAPSMKAAMGRGWLFGVGHFALGNNWIQHAFDFQDKMPPVLGYVAVVLLALYLAIYPAVACGLAWRFAYNIRPRWNEPDIGFVLAASAAWIATEWLRGVMFTGYPWNPLGVIWVPVPGVAQIAAFTGTYALSGVTMLVAGAIFLASRRNYWLLAEAVVLLLLIGFGLNPGRPVEDMARPHVRIVQPNIGQEGVERPDYPARVLNKLAEWSGRPGTSPRLVVWPEGMVNYYVESGYPLGWYRGSEPEWTRGRIASLLGPRDRAMVSGNALFFGADGKLSGAGNSVWSIDPAGQLGQRYDKGHLVPYGEYLPMRDLLAPLGLARLVMGDIDFIPGAGPHTLNVPGFGKAGVAVCYEVIFSGSIVDRGNRPDFLFNPSNDAWFGSWGPVQHLAQARLRAIEEGLPILRATPTGVSALIDGHGRVLEQVPAGQEGAIEAPLPPALPETLFARLGNWLALAVTLFFAVLAVAFRRAAR
jgi:apolipoprotein N-acyltransferase